MDHFVADVIRSSVTKPLSPPAICSHSQSSDVNHRTGVPRSIARGTVDDPINIDEWKDDIDVVRNVSKVRSLNLGTKDDPIDIDEWTDEPVRRVTTVVNTNIDRRRAEEEWNQLQAEWEWMNSFDFSWVTPENHELEGAMNSMDNDSIWDWDSVLGEENLKLINDINTDEVAEDSQSDDSRSDTIGDTSDNESATPFFSYEA